MVVAYSEADPERLLRSQLLEQILELASLLCRLVWMFTNACNFEWFISTRALVGQAWCIAWTPLTANCDFLCMWVESMSNCKDDESSDWLSYLARYKSLDGNLYPYATDSTAFPTVQANHSVKLPTTISKYPFRHLISYNLASIINQVDAVALRPFQALRYRHPSPVWSTFPQSSQSWENGLKTSRNATIKFLSRFQSLESPKVLSEFNTASSSEILRTMKFSWAMDFAKDTYAESWTSKWRILSGADGWGIAQKRPNPTEWRRRTAYRSISRPSADEEMKIWYTKCRNC